MKKIYVVKLGWVLVGDVVPSSEPGVTVLQNAAVVRKWGTANGLGELALKGPLQETTLDACGTVEIQDVSILFCITCSENNWK